MRALGMVAVLAVVGLALVAGTVVLAYLAGRRRRAELAAVAARRGWEFAERDDTWVAAFAGAPFGLGHRRRAVNVLRGTHGDRRFVAFDYCYDTTEASTDAEGRVSSREVTHWFTIVAVDADAVFPALEVTPESFFGRMMGRLTGDIQFESEAFNRAFTVRCPDRKFAFDVLHPRAMEYLLAHPDAAFRLDRRYVLSVLRGSASIAQVDRSLALVDGLLALVPGFVWQDARGS